MTEVLINLLFYFVGMIVCYCIFQPMEQYEKGFKAGKALFGDFEKWYDAGWESAKRFYTDWDIQQEQEGGKPDDEH